MHFIVSWDIAANQRRAEIEGAFTQVLSRSNWVRPLTTFYIVPVSGALEYGNLANQLQAVAQRYPADAQVLISPMLGPGQYAGFLPGNLWPEINKRTSA